MRTGCGQGRGTKGERAAQIHRQMKIRRRLWILWTGRVVQISSTGQGCAKNLFSDVNSAYQQRDQVLVAERRLVDERT